MFREFFGRRPEKKEGGKTEYGVAATPDRVNTAFSQPNESGVGFDKGHWGPQDTQGSSPAPHRESPNAVLDQPMADYVSAVGKEETHEWTGGNHSKEIIDLPPEAPANTSGNTEEEPRDLAAK